MNLLKCSVFLSDPARSTDEDKTFKDVADDIVIYFQYLDSLLSKTHMHFTFLSHE